MISVPPNAPPPSAAAAFYDQQAPSTSQQCGMPIAAAPQQQYYQNRHYGAGNYPRSPSRAQPLRNAYDQTQYWMNGQHYLDRQQAVNEYNPSPAPSVMSNVSRMSIPDDVSVISAQTNVTTLGPVNQQSRLTELRGNYADSTSSCIENANPEVVHVLNQRLDEILKYFNRPDVRSKVMYKVYEMAEKNYLQYVEKKKLYMLIHKIKTALEDQMVDPRMLNYLLYSVHLMLLNGDCRKVFMDIVAETSNAFLCLLGHWMKINKAALFAMHTLLQQDGADGHRCRQLARVPFILDNVLYIVANVIFPNSMASAIHVLQLLIGKNNQFRSYAVEHHAIIIVLAYVHSEWSSKVDDITAKNAFTALIEMVDTDDRTVVEKFVEADGIQKVAARLSTLQLPKSLDAVQQGIRLLSLVSDAKAVDHKEVRQSIQQVLQLLHMNDICYREHATGFLANIIANKPHNKRFLIDNDLFNVFAFFFATYSRRENFKPEERSSIDDVIANSCMCLSNLIPMNVDQEKQARRDMIFDKDEFRRSILNHLQQGSIEVRSRILRFAHLLLLNTEHWKKRILEVFDDYRKENLIGVLFGIVSQYKTPPSENLHLKREILKVLSRVYIVLTVIMQKCDNDVKNMVINITRHSSVSPLEVLRAYSDDDLTTNVLTFCDLIADEDPAIISFVNDGTTLETLANSVNPTIGRTASSILSKLGGQQDFVNPLAGVFASMGNGDSMDM